MSHTLAASRLSRWGIAMAAATAGLLSCSAAANATVYHPSPTGNAFRQAVLDANANPGFDKIIIDTTFTSFTATNLTITDDLYITSDHKHDGGDPNFFGPALSGGSVDVRPANFITVNPGVRLEIAGIEINQASENGFATIFNNNGKLRLDNMAFLGNSGNIVSQAGANASTVITNTTITDNAYTAPTVLSNGGGSVTINNSTIADAPGGGPQVDGPFVLRNTVLSFVGSQSCFTTPGAGSSNNWSTDTSCGPTAGVGDPQLDFVFYYSGPTQTRPPLAGSPLVNAGNPATCASSDQGFRVRPAAGGTCDIGAVENGAVRDTTPPTCAVTATRRGPDEQDVTVSDTGSGLGYDSVFSEDITITNGTVAFTGLPPLGGIPADPARPGNTVVTAAKANQSLKTKWSFIARDWAGNTQACS
ncbi:MAG TPA: choice-of-anchor Q domain-containing protein [Solirubrobacter sp.]